MVKTRLAAFIGKEEAARVQEKLLRFTLGVVADFKRERPEVDEHLLFTPEEKRDHLEQTYAGPWCFSPQSGVDWGRRMQFAVETLMRRGYRHVLVIGTDVPDITPQVFHEAFDSLERGWTVLGPAVDGGFYLIGMDRPCPVVFEQESWGAHDVFAGTKGHVVLNN